MWLVGGRFQLADGHGELDGLLGKAEHGVRRVEGHEGLGVSEAELGGFDQGEDIGGELEQAQEVGDRGAVLAGALRHLLLGEAEFAGEALVGAGLLDGVEILALEVLDDGDLHGLLVGDLADDGGDGGFAGALGGEPAALSGDELEAFAGLGRTVMGWMTPETWMDSASSLRAVSSKWVRVW